MSELTVAAAGPVIVPGPAPATRLDSKPARPNAERGRLKRHPAVWVLRTVLVAPVVFMGPEFVALALGQPKGVSDVAASANDVFGNAAWIFFVLMLTVTPLVTVTGWTWHKVLRRDFGLGMFFVAMTDLVCAATVSATTFKGGLITRVAGHTFLFAGTLATLLLVPLALTANKRAQRWLGPHWAWLHRLVYAAWAIILIHLAFLFAFRSFFIDALLVSAPLFLLRLPPIRDRWVASRRAGTRKVVRAGGLIVMVGVFGLGFEPFVRELIHVGVGAFILQPA